MRVLFIISFFLFYSFLNAQLNVKKLNTASIPKTIKYKGNLNNAVTWTDSYGLHYVLTSETGAVDSKTEPELDNRDASLFAYHYLSAADTFQLIWKMSDFIKDCPVDLKATFVKNTFAVTDLNKDGQAEVWLMYQTACRGDVSPSDMKIIMYENSRKYAVRGTAKVKLAENSYEGGRYAFDDAFIKGPEAFRTYAKRLWEKNILETWE